MKNKKVLIIIIVVGIMIGGVLNTLKEAVLSKVTQEIAATLPTFETAPETVPETTSETTPETTPETTAETIPETTVKLSDADRLGVSEKELQVIEYVMSVSGWEYVRDDFERIYRLKDTEMVLNPATFIEYDVSIFNGETHRLTVNRDLVE